MLLPELLPASQSLLLIIGGHHKIDRRGIRRYNSLLLQRIAQMCQGAVGFDSCRLIISRRNQVDRLLRSGQGFELCFGLLELLGQVVDMRHIAIKGYPIIEEQTHTGRHTHHEEHPPIPLIGVAITSLDGA